MSSTSATPDRVIRVFVSSTFRDMQAERDELVLKIFPHLRRLCEERGVTWGEIDLRWGITEEQSQRGEVLPICLEEIKRCRPYFIGLLGERYGWIPDAIPTEVLEHEPWIRDHADGADSHKKSVTELEILHGVLNNPEMADHAFFYFRDPTFIDRLSADQKQEDFLTEDDQSRQKLNRLKDDIRQQHRDGKLKYEPRENYPDAKSLGERVLADFTALIDTLYPQGPPASDAARPNQLSQADFRNRRMDDSEDRTQAQAEREANEDAHRHAMDVLQRELQNRMVEYASAQRSALHKLLEPVRSLCETAVQSIQTLQRVDWELPEHLVNQSLLDVISAVVRESEHSSGNGSHSFDDSLKAAL